MCANLFPLICNSSPDSNPPRAEENNRTGTVETADGLSRRAQSGVRCALLHASAHSVHAQKCPAHTTQSLTSTPERVDLTHHITARTRITSPEPHNAFSAHKRDVPESLQCERLPYPGEAIHQIQLLSTHAAPDNAHAPRDHSTHTTRTNPRSTEHHETPEKARQGTLAAPLRMPASAGKVRGTPIGPPVEQERTALLATADLALSSRARPDRLPKPNPMPGRHLTEHTPRPPSVPHLIRSDRRMARKNTLAHTPYTACVAAPLGRWCSSPL